MNAGHSSGLGNFPPSMASVLTSIAETTGLDVASIQTIKNLTDSAFYAAATAPTSLVASEIEQLEPSTALGHTYRDFWLDTWILTSVLKLTSSQFNLDAIPAASVTETGNQSVGWSFSGTVMRRIRGILVLDGNPPHPGGALPLTAQSNAQFRILPGSTWSSSRTGWGLSQFQIFHQFGHRILAGLNRKVFLMREGMGHWQQRISKKRTRQTADNLIGNRANHERANGPTWRLKRLLAGLFLVGALLASCGRAVDPNPLRSIAVEKEVLIQGVRGKSNAIAVAVDGSVAVAGQGQVAWAIGLAGDGRVQWKYEDPARDSVFLNVVPLTSGNWLFCGRANAPHGTVGLVAIVDARGSLVERNEWTPNGDPKLTLSDFRQCVPWGEGIALVGNTVMNPDVPFSAGHPRSSRAWFVKLDANGKKLWETLRDDYLGVLAADSPRANQRITAAGGYHAGKEAVTVFRISEKVDILQRRIIDNASGFAWLRRTTPNQADQIVIYPPQKPPKIHSLGDDLGDNKSARSIEAIYIDQGCGYLLSNNYMALFGYVQKGGGGISLTRPYTAAVALIDPSGTTVAIDIFDVIYDSFTVRDAAFIGANRFVAVRDVNGQDPEKNGINVSWIRFQ